MVAMTVLFPVSITETVSELWLEMYARRPSWLMVTP
jgi:hypothetical protein